MGAVGFAQVASCPNTSTSRAWGAAVEDDFNFVMLGELFCAFAGEFAADDFWGEVGALIFIVNQASDAFFAVWHDSSLWG